MASTGLNGPYALVAAKIDEVVAPNRIGTYALGYSSGDAWYVRYVGRSDTDLRGRLKQHVNEDREFAEFKFAYYPSAHAAYEKECGIYHDFEGREGGLKNDVHPAKPTGVSWGCPRCGA